MLDLLFFLISRLNNACSPLVINLHGLINRSGLRISHSKFSAENKRSIFLNNINDDSICLIDWVIALQSAQDAMHTTGVKFIFIINLKGNVNCCGLRRNFSILILQLQFCICSIFSETVPCNPVRLQMFE